LLAPELYAVARQTIAGNLVTAPVLWRSSAPGVDLISFVLPNPVHRLAPQRLVDWVATQPGHFDENVMSLSLVGFVVIAAAWRWGRFRPDRLWIGITAGFASLAVGPFLRVAGVETFVPTPWALLRYVPLIGEARMPPRFGVVVALGFTVLIADALSALGTRFPQRRRWILGGAAVALAIELVPAPRSLYTTDLPGVYRVIAADERPVRLLEVPFGMRDGLSSLGEFTAISQFYQTAHGKPLFGGYLSRIEERTKQAYLQVPFLKVLMDLSAGAVPTEKELAAAKVSAETFLATSRLGYVVIDTVRSSPRLRGFTIDALGLTRIDASGPIELYVPEPRGAPPNPLRIIKE